VLPGVNFLSKKHAGQEAKQEPVCPEKQSDEQRSQSYRSEADCQPQKV
jgi:hypothetical protein